MASKYFNISDFINDDYSTTFILGARGVGKTISSLSYYIKRCYNNSTKFIYLRRYQSEIDTLGFNLALLSKLTGLKVEQESAKDDSGRVSTMITANGNPVGYLLALSVASKYKSNDYTNTEAIIYDEFIDIRGRELKNEVVLFLNFAMTVFRDFTKYKAIFLANATNLFNCYFISFNTFPKSKVTKFKKESIKIVMYQATDQLKERDKTPLALLVRQAGDGGSSLDNNFKEQTGFINKLNKDASCQVLIKLGDKLYALWLTGSIYVVSDKLDPSTKLRVSIDELDDKYKYDPSVLATISLRLIDGALFFDSELTRGVWLRELKDRRLI